MVFGIFGGGGSSSSSHGEASSAVVAQLEQQIQMMDMVFRNLVKRCKLKCIQLPYRDGELNKGESVCLQRCFSKFDETLQVASAQLAEVGMQAQNTGTPSL